MNKPYGNVLTQSVISELPTTDAEIDTNSLIRSEAINIAIGAFSPLSGFMNEADFNSVCTKQSLSTIPLTWTIPVVFDISQPEKVKLENKKRILLKYNSENYGMLEVESIFQQDKKLRCQSVYGTLDESHPGVKLVSEMGNFLISGKVFVLKSYIDKYVKDTPISIREKIQKAKLNTVAGFQTRNAIHRAHEYLQRTALELCDGLLVQPVVGWKKIGDFIPEAVRASYETFIKDYFPKNKVILSFLELAMRYAGPNEAVFHAIIRKNYGCTHFIVGRDHAGVGSFYGTYDAQDIFDRLPYPLGIEILKLKEPFYCKKCECIASEKTCGHSENEREYISGTKIRNILNTGKAPNSNIFRPEVLQSLNEIKGNLFYEST